MKLNRITKLKMAVMAEAEFAKHLREVIGIDTSSFQTGKRYVPELGITYTETYYPDRLKDYFHKWMRDVYLPQLFSPPKGE